MTEVRTIIDGTTARMTFVTDNGLNVLSTPVLKKVHEAAVEIAAATGVRLTIVGAEGKAFLAGADIKEMSAFKPEQARAFSELGNKAFDALAALPSVTVAAINGAALGGGLEVALACDFRIAVKSAKLGLPESSLGLIPGWGGIRRSVHLIGPARAKQLLFSANAVSAEQALAWALVDEIVNSAEDLAPRVLAFGKTLTRGGPHAVARIKKAIQSGDEIEQFVECFRDPESFEGLKSFMEKRPAAWTVQ
jgi:enoyl-CoA hydratase